MLNKIRYISICGHAINQENPFFEVEDTLKDERFYDNPLVTGAPYIRSYSGMQLISSEGYKLGMLCVIDTRPHILLTQHVLGLKLLSHYISCLLEFRLLRKISDEKSCKIEMLEGTQDMLLNMIAHDAELYNKKLSPE